ncbi:MAG: peptidase [Spirochaetae bacterium HGW-Spirochaetae-2]|jgi:ATP-dependent Clp protease protease subunit|nr:MAG: peptidase [Spirochaetae bacterium HGW-Spirochaetae-2]
MKNRKFWQWKNQGEDESTARILELSGTIAEESWFDDDVTPEQFRDELFADSGEVTVWINSPGGDCIAASRIYAMLMEYPGHITVKIDGIAASAASVIAMAGTSVLMAPTALMMIHNPMTLAYGNHADMQKAIGMLDEVKQSIVNAYEIKTNLTRAKISHLMDNETWMNAKKAIELGFADAILEDAKKTSNEVPYSFSTKNSQLSLLNKITDTYAHIADQAPPEAGTIGLCELEKRLNLIKPQ